MTLLTARLLLAIPLGVGIAWTVAACCTVGRQHVTSRYLAALVTAEPVLVGLWAIMLDRCGASLAEGNEWDRLLLAASWSAWAHVCWRLG